MTSFLRSLFSAGPHHGSSSSRSSKSKSRQRASSTPPADERPMSNYVFIKSGMAPSTTSSSSSRTRSNSYSSQQVTPPMPSPLRYSTRDSASSHGHGSTSSRRSSRERPSLPRSSSYKPERDSSSPYSIYGPRRVSLSSSSRTASSNSVTRPGSSASHYTPLPRNPSTGSVSSQGSGSLPRRPALKSNNSWHGKAHNPNAHVTFMNPSRTEALHMHPVLACSKQSHAPISYDVTYPPSPRTIVDRNTRASVPAHTLQQPATDPITVSTLVLTSEKLPWPVVVSSKSKSSSKSPAKFYLGGEPASRSPSSGSSPVTNIDVLQTLHETLYMRVTQEEWDALGSGSSRQKRIWKTYEARCERAGGGYTAGVRRIDFLGEKTRLVGIEVDRCTDGGKLVFARP